MSTVGWRIAAGAFPLRSKSKFDLRADDGESGAADDVPMKPIDTSPAPPAIVVQGLTKRYGELTAVDDLSFAALAGLPRGRVDELLAIVGLEQAGGRRVGKYSTGMRQRLGLAAALLGDPGILGFDGALNGL